MKNFEHKVLMGVASLVALTAGSLSARAEADSPKDKAESAMRSEKEATEMKPKSLKDEIVGVKPQLGVLVFNEAENGVSGDTSSRAAYGFTLDVNLARWSDADRRQWFVGPSTGLIYSHIGGVGSNFFGTGDVKGGNNLVIIPLNLKVGYNVSDHFRASVHAGGNAVYRSVGSQMNLGDQGRTEESDTTLYPNVGMDFEFGKKVVLMVRPDLTLTPEDEIFTGTVALSIPIS